MSQYLLTAQIQSESFSINEALLLAQIINLIVIVAYIWLVCKAIARAIKSGEGAEVPLWIFAIVLLPIFGAVAALLYFSKSKQTSPK